MLNDGSQNFLNPIRMARAVAVMAMTKNRELKLSPPTPLLIWTYLGMVIRRAKANKMWTKLVTWRKHRCLLGNKRANSCVHKTDRNLNFPPFPSTGLLQFCIALLSSSSVSSLILSKRSACSSLRATIAILTETSWTIECQSSYLTTTNWRQAGCRYIEGGGNIKRKNNDVKLFVILNEPFPSREPIPFILYI